MLVVEGVNEGQLSGSRVQWAQVHVHGAAVGCLELEVEKGAFLSAARPLLVLPCAAAAAEVRQLEQGAPGEPRVCAWCVWRWGGRLSGPRGAGSRVEGSGCSHLWRWMRTTGGGCARLCGCAPPVGDAHDPPTTPRSHA